MTSGTVTPVCHHPNARRFLRRATTTAVHGPRAHVWLAIACSAALGAASTCLAAETSTNLVLRESERLLVVVPHPDDESLAAAGLMQQVVAGHGVVVVVTVTAGDGYVEAVVHETGQLRPRPALFLAYGERRLAEQRAAVRELGDSHVRLKVLGFPDGGLQDLLNAHWRRTRPERSQTTGVEHPPYPEVTDPNIAYDGGDLRRELGNLIRESKPTIIAMPDPLDAHPDHRATGLFTLLAIEDCFGRKRNGLPRLLAFLVHWPGWPSSGDPSTADSRTGSHLELPEDLPQRGLLRVSLPLTQGQVATKDAAVSRYRSQLEVLGDFLRAFVHTNEVFTVFTRAQVTEARRSVEAEALQAPAEVNLRRRARPPSAHAP